MVAVSVTVSVVSERQGASASLRNWKTLELAAGGGQRAHRREGAVAVGERDLQHAGAGAEDGERLGLAEHVDQARADRPAGRGGRGDDAVGVAEQDAAAERRGAGRERALEQVAPRGVALFRAGQPVEALRHEIGDVVDVVGGLGDRLAVMVEHLHHGADADGEQEGDDEGGHRAAQRGLGGQQASISGVGDRLRQPLDRIRSRGRTRRFGARHGPVPDWMIPELRARNGVPHRLESVAIRIDGDSLVESPSQYF